MSQSAVARNTGILPENWGLLYAAFAFSQGIGLISYWVLPILAGALISGLGLTGTQVGLLGTVEFAGLLVSSLALAPFIDRGFRKLVALISIVIVIAGNLLCAAIALDYEQLSILRFLCGVGSGLALALGNATIANAKDAEKFSGHLTIALVAFMVVIMPVFARLSEQFGHQGVFLGLAGTVAIGAISIFFLPNGPNSALANEESATASGASSTGLLSVTAILILIVAVLFGIRDTLPWLVAEQLGVDAGMSLPEIGNLFSLMYAVSIIGPASMLFLSRILGPKVLLAVSMTATGLFAFMFTVSAGNALQFSLGIIIWATVYFIAFAQLNAVAAMIDRSGRLVSAVGSGFIAGVMAGPVIGGVLLDGGGYWSIGAAELAITALIALVILLGLRMGPTSDEPADQGAPARLQSTTPQYRGRFMPGLNSTILKGMLINGEWRDGAAGSFASYSPYSGEKIHDIGRCSRSDADAAVAAAKAAYPAWRAMSVIDRATIMRNVHRLFVDRAEEIAQMVTAEVGKPILSAREETFEYSAPSWRKAAEEIVRFRGQSLPSTQDRTNNKRLVTTHRPLGVVGVITPYNFPTDISSIALAHAAVAGNTVVWKPTEYAPVSCAMVAELFAEAGVPPGVINMVQGFGDVGAAIVENKDVDGIFFTGSTETGEKIARVDPLRPMLLELGGDGPMIVLEDADIDEAVEGAVIGCFYYTGQVCTSAERLLIHEAVYGEFMAKFRAAIKALSFGDPADATTDIGPLCNDATLKRARAHVDDARAKGAKIEQFGPEEDLFYPATIVTNVTDDMLVMQEESFSPIAVVIKVSSAEEAVEIANKSDLGLVASLWTRNLSDAWRIAEALPHGTVNVNETNNYWDQLAPFGGAGRSGVGRELSNWFFESFTEKKLINFDLGGPKSDRRIEGGW